MDIENGVSKEEVPDYKLLIDTAALAGMIMLENGAEIYRVEETINYILKTSGLKTIQSFVLSTGFMISLDDPKIDALNVVRRVNKNGVNLNVIALVNDISRKFYKGEITLKQAFSQLKHIETRQYPWWLNNICTIGVMVFFTGMFGGNWADMGANLIVGLVLTIWIDIGKKIELNSLIKDMLASIVLSATASILTKIYPVLHLNLVIIGAIMVLVPGAAITNAIRDTLHGDYASGNANILEAFAEAAMIALGVYVGLIVTGATMY